MACVTGSCDLDSGLISCEDYKCLADLYSQARERVLAVNQDLLDAVYQIVMLQTCIPEIDLLSSFWNSYNLSSSQFNTPTALLEAVRALNNHVIVRGGYTEIDEFFAACTTDGTPITVDETWQSLSSEVGFDISDTYVTS